jgi:hypothetical protein
MIIQVAMLKHVTPLMGTAYYNYLLTKRTTEVANYNPLLGTVFPMFPNDADLEALWVEGGLEALTASATILVWLPYGTIQNRSVGQQTINTQYSQSGEVKGIQFMSDTLLSDLEYLKTKVVAALNLTAPEENCKIESSGGSESVPYNFIIY